MASKIPTLSKLNLVLFIFSSLLVVLGNICTPT
jgi:hypothetical protein